MVQGPARLAVRRVRLRSLVRVGCTVGWLVSLLPALLLSAASVWVLQNVWSTLGAWAPWSPWTPGQRIGGVTLPTPEFRPREVLRVERFYQLLTPVGEHPWLATLLGAIGLTVLGGLVITLVLLLAGLGYNLFASATGGIEFDLAPQAAPRSRGSASERARWEDTDPDDLDRLEW